MNCEDFRASVSAQPQLESESLQAHAAECDPCSRHRAELRAMDELIARALRIDVPTTRQRRTVRRNRTPWWPMAASVLAAAVLGSALWLVQPRTSLATDLAEHARGEEQALIRTSHSVDPATLVRVMRSARVRLKPDALLVTYAMSCRFRGHDVPHLVVQTANGPVTVMVLRHEREEEQPREFAEEGFRGVIMPAPAGSLAVLSRGPAVTAAARTVLAAMEYE